MSRALSLVVACILIAPASAQEPPKLLPDFTGNPAPKTDRRKIPPQLLPVHTSSIRGMDWLQRANQPDGKFLSGFIPALAIKSEADPFLPQTEATLALIRAARFNGDDKAMALGKQSLLRLLTETIVDSAQPTIRFTAAPEPFVNRLAACGGLLRAIQELPQPPDDLRLQARQLATYLASQLQADGSFRLESDDPAFKVHLLQTCTGPALAGLVAYELRGSGGLPKSDRAGKALEYYIAQWKRAKTPVMIPDHTAAYADWYLATGDARFAEAVFEMNDWLVTLQYPHDPRHPQWAGGFMPWQDGRSLTLPPDQSSAALACSLVDACRVAKKAGDERRLAKYRQSLEMSLGFLTTLQYTEARVQHFAEWFRPWVNGGFMNGHQDGNLRLSTTANATAAMVGYLQFAME